MVLSGDSWFVKMEVLQMGDGGDNCRATPMFSVPLDCALTMVYVHFIHLLPHKIPLPAAFGTLLTPGPLGSQSC